MKIQIESQIKINICKNKKLFTQTFIPQKTIIFKTIIGKLFQPKEQFQINTYKNCLVVRRITSLNNPD